MPLPPTYTNFVAPAIQASNLNEVNLVVYQLLGNGVDAPINDSDIRTNLGLGPFATMASPVPVANGGTGDTGTAWTSGFIGFVPTVGAFGDANAVIRYKILGKTVFFNLILTVLTNGTGASGGLVSMPFTAATESSFVGRESQTTGFAIAATMSGNQLTVVRYDNTYPFGNSYRVSINGVVEIV